MSEKHCSVEGCDHTGHVVMGMCTKHYQRWRMYGDTDSRRSKDWGAPKTCSVDGCERDSIKRGLCSMHYQRWQHHGSTDQKRPPDWGKRMAHPLWGKWDYHMSTGKSGIVPEWRDFWTFAAAVGSPPGPDEEYQLMKVRMREPIGPDNFKWHKIGEVKPRDKQTTWSKLNPDRHRRHYLKKNYNVTPEWYDETLASQGHGCAICGNVCARVVSGKTRWMHVDHDHTTGKVRGILCNACNTGIGYFKDDIVVLRNAISYLEKHGASGTPSDSPEQGS